MEAIEDQINVTLYNPKKSVLKPSVTTSLSPIKMLDYSLPTISKNSTKMAVMKRGLSAAVAKPIKPMPKLRSLSPPIMDNEISNEQTKPPTVKTVKIAVDQYKQA